MSPQDEPAVVADKPRPAGLRLWHLSVVVLAVAVAGAMVREGRMQEPLLIALAVAGFLGWCLVAGLGFRLVWRELRRPDGGGESRRRTRRQVAAVLIYLFAMTTSFVIGLWIYLSIEFRYLGLNR
jgi:hypothetical protein